MPSGNVVLATSLFYFCAGTTHRSFKWKEWMLLYTYTLISESSLKTFVSQSTGAVLFLWMKIFVLFINVSMIISPNHTIIQIIWIIFNMHCKTHLEMN